MAVDPVRNPIETITVNGTTYTIVDSAVPAWAKLYAKPTYNGGEVKYTGTTGNVVTNNTTLNVAVQALDTAVNNRLKYVLLSQAEYDSLATKDSGTLYLIEETTQYSVSLVVTGSAHVPTVTINNVVYQQTDFPIEVNSGESLTIVCGGAMSSITITMGGSTVATGISGDTLTIPNVNNDIVIAAHSSAPE